MGNFWRDIRIGLRSLGSIPGFAAVVILTLGLGIGANTAIFSVVYGVLLRPLPYAHAERIVSLEWTYKGEPADNLDDHQFRYFFRHRQPFEYYAADTPVGFDLTGGSQPERVIALRVSSEYFHVLGVQPALGRDFAPSDDVIGGPRVAILGYGLWKSNFGGDRGILGKGIALDGIPYTVIGVMPAGFSNTPTPGAPNSGDAEVWTTIAPVSKTMIGSGGNYEVLARLKPGVTLTQAQSYMQIASAGLLAEFPKKYQAGLAMGVYSYLDSITGGFRTPLLILFGAIGFVLLIACVNVANLVMARAATRDREIAIRTALGASRSRLFRQLLTESVLLSLLGGALGLLLADWGLHLLLSLIPAGLPRAQDIFLDRWALGFTALVAILSGILFGLAPAFRSSRADLNASLKESAGHASAGGSHQRFRGALVVAEIALSVILLSGASLLIATFANLLSTNPGFDPRPLLSLPIWTTSAKYNTMAAESNFYDSIVTKIRAIPGVQNAGVIAAGLPLKRGGNFAVRIAGARATRWLETDYREITPDYFRVMGIPLLRGRYFRAADSAGAAKVVIINRAFARRYFPGRDPLGQRLLGYAGKTNPASAAMSIVGVTGDVKSFLDQPAPPTFFVPLAQASYGTDQLFQGWFPTSVIVRTSQNPLRLSREVTAAIRSVDSEIPVGHVQSMDQVLSTALSLQRFSMSLMGIFAGLALLLAAVGIYGMMAYSVARRRHEIGIRLALGARPANVLAMIVGRGLQFTAAGLLIGLGGALALTRLLSGQLYGVKPNDPLALAMVSAVLTLVAVVACYIPARRAAGVDPLIALRYE